MQVGLIVLYARYTMDKMLDSLINAANPFCFSLSVMSKEKRDAKDMAGRCTRQSVALGTDVGWRA